VRWLPFQLNPDVPEEGIPRQEYLERKFGRDPDLKEIAEEMGIEEEKVLELIQFSREHVSLDAPVEELAPAVFVDVNAILERRRQGLLDLFDLVVMGGQPDGDDPVVERHDSTHCPSQTRLLGIHRRL